MYGFIKMVQKPQNTHSWGLTNSCILCTFLIHVFLSLSSLPDALPPPKLSVMTYGPVPKLYVKDKQNVEISCSIDSTYLKPRDYVTHPIHTYTVTLNYIANIVSGI